MSVHNDRAKLHHFSTGAIMWQVPGSWLRGRWWCTKSGLCLFSHIWVPNLSAVPVSACASFTRPHKEHCSSEAASPPAPPLAPTTEARRASPETQPPKGKRPKREQEDENELEDGELTDSSGDGDEEGDRAEPEGDGQEVTSDQNPAGDAGRGVEEEAEDSCHCWRR